MKIRSGANDFCFERESDSSSALPDVQVRRRHERAVSANRRHFEPAPLNHRALRLPAVAFKRVGEGPVPTRRLV